MSMTEKSFETKLGTIRYWVSETGAKAAPQLVFLPGLTADHRLFDKQTEYFGGKYPMLVWDAPGHADSYPFRLTFTMEDKVRMLDDILRAEGFDAPVIVGQSMGGYLGQMYEELFSEKLKG